VFMWDKIFPKNDKVTIEIARPSPELSWSTTRHDRGWEVGLQVVPITHHNESEGADQINRN